VSKASNIFHSTASTDPKPGHSSASSLSNIADPRANDPFVEECPAFTMPDETILTETFDLDNMLVSSQVTHVATEQEIVAEMSAAAEEFVIEQQHHAHSPAADGSITSALLKTAAPSHAGQTRPSEPAKDRRRKHRALISAPIRVRRFDITSEGPDEIATTVDVSRVGILLHTRLDCYYRAMEVAVIFPYSESPNAIQTERIGRVARITDLGNGTRSVAIALGGSEGINASIATAPQDSMSISSFAVPQTKKPLVLAMDTDGALRDNLKSYLQNEGYDVIAVSNACDAREVLNMFTPALIVAEVEGDGTPGFDICSFVKASPRLKQIPVVLTTNSAYPSDYSNAHARGAVVCMAKPYKQDRMGHIVRLLAPLPEHLQSTAAPRPADPTRVPGRDCTLNGRMQNIVRGNGNSKKTGTNGNGKSRFKFPSFR